jgi:hypothetical protein
MKNKTKLELIKEKLKKTTVKVELMKAVTSEGVGIEIEGELVEGSLVYLQDNNSETEEGVEREFAPNGTHIIAELGKEIVVEDGVIMSIADVEITEEEQSTDTEENETNLEITPEEQTAIITEIMQILDPRFEEINQLINARIAELGVRIDEIEANINGGESTVSEEEFNKVKTELEKLKDEAGGKSKTNTDDTDNSKYKKLTVTEKLARLKSVVSNKK